MRDVPPDLSSLTDDERNARRRSLLSDADRDLGGLAFPLTMRQWVTITERIEQTAVQLRALFAEATRRGVTLEWRT